MSFILDALKKSEIERQRQSVPGLMEAGIVRPRRRLPLWAIALAVLLAINLTVLVVVLTRNGAPVAAAPAPGPADVPAATDGPRSAAAAGPFSPLDAAPDYAPEIPVDGPAPTPAGVVAARPAPARTGKRRDPLLSDADPVARPYGTIRPDAAAHGSPAVSDDEVLPTINELSTSGAQALPALHLDVHVYGTRPADRFVYVNNRKYHEGATLQEGPRVEHIRRDGVVLNYAGMRFLLPRQ